MSIAIKQSIPQLGWRKYLWLLSTVVPCLGMMSIAGYMLSGNGLWAWWGIFFVYVIIPALDLIFGEDTTNPDETQVAQLESHTLFRWLVIINVPIQYAATVWGAWMIAHYHPAWWVTLGFIFTIGGINGIGINTAHELGHKKEKLERWLSKVALGPTCYGHFFVEHNRGHHKNVATPQDPASAKMGESFWHFLPRTMIGSLRSAWHLETERLARLGKSPWSWENENLRAWSVSVMFFGVLVAWLGWGVLPFLLIQAFYGASLLEVVNYIEHYGLLRQKSADGRYVRCEPEHSWNSNQIVSNLFLYHLQRHSDHHAHPTRRYQSLRHFDQSPQLPAGYAAMLVMAYVPWIWYRVMDPRVVKHYQGQARLINLYPARREALIKRYHLSTQAPASAR
jgi:alkane 1-monooxygenase